MTNTLVSWLSKDGKIEQGISQYDVLIIMLGIMIFEVAILAIHM